MIRTERLRERRRMQRRIRAVIEERRMALVQPPADEPRELAAPAEPAA